MLGIFFIITRSPPRMDFESREIPVGKLILPPEVMARTDEADYRLLETIYGIMQQINAENTTSIDAPAEIIEYVERPGTDFPEIGLRILFSSDTLAGPTLGQQSLFAWAGWLAGERIGPEDIQPSIAYDAEGRPRVCLTVLALMYKSKLRRRYQKQFILKYITGIVAAVSPIAEFPEGLVARKKAGNMISVEHQHTPRKMQRLKEEARAKQLAAQQQQQKKPGVTVTPLSPSKRLRDDEHNTVFGSGYERPTKAARLDAMQPSVNMPQVDMLFDS